MDYDPVEGIHYIFDRYTFLNSIMEDGGLPLRLSPQSDQAEIATVIKRARAIHHPDKQSNAGKKNQQDAAYMTHLIVECEKILSDADLRAFYDTKLAEFQKAHPKRVSTNGMPIIDLSAGFFDMTALLSDTVVDTRQFEDLVKAHLRYDEARFQQMKTLYAVMSDNAQIADLYREALTSKLVYLTLLEDAAWAKIGYRDVKSKVEGILSHADEYADRVEEKARSLLLRDLDAHITGHGAAARLGFTPLLLTFNGEAAKDSGVPTTDLIDPAQLTDALARMKEKAAENFEIRLAYVRDIAAQKQQVLQELVTLSPVEVLRARIPAEDLIDIYVVEEKDEAGAQKVIFRARFLVADSKISDLEFFKAGESIEDIRMLAHACGAYAVTRNSEIDDLMLEAVALCERLMERDVQPAPAVQPKSTGGIRPG